MAFIRIQKLKKDESGKILSGSASIIDVNYDPKAKGVSLNKLITDIFNSYIENNQVKI